MNLKRIISSVYTENCYLIWDDNNIGAVIDPGSDFSKIDSAVKENNVKLEAILLTHGHFDHAYSADEFSKKYSLPVMMSENEKEVMQGNEDNPDTRIAVPENFLYFHDNDIIKAGGITLKVIATPGHTKGSVCFYCESEKTLFAGDTLFRSTVGRWDLPTGSFDDLKKSVKNRLYTLPDSVKVYSGHGFSTDLGWEKTSNGVIRC